MFRALTFRMSQHLSNLEPRMTQKAGQLPELHGGVGRHKLFQEPAKGRSSAVFCWCGMLLTTAKRTPGRRHHALEITTQATASNCKKARRIAKISLNLLNPNWWFSSTWFSCLPQCRVEISGSFGKAMACVIGSRWTADTCWYLQQKACRLISLARSHAIIRHLFVCQQACIHDHRSLIIHDCFSDIIISLLHRNCSLFDSLLAGLLSSICIMTKTCMLPCSSGLCTMLLYMTWCDNPWCL